MSSMRLQHRSILLVLGATLGASLSACAVAPTADAGPGGAGGATTSPTGSTTATSTSAQTTTLRGPTTYRSPVDQPFASDSVWNLPVGSGAEWESVTDPATAQLVGTKGSLLAAGYGKRFWVGTASDPTLVVKDTDQDPAYAVPEQTLHVPFSTLPGDAQIRWPTFFDFTVPGKPYMYSYYGDTAGATPPGCPLTWTGGAITGMTCQLAAVVNVCGDGIATVHGASRYDFAIGTIRHADLVQKAIRHTLRYAVSLDVARSLEIDANGTNPSAWEHAVWPNDNEDYWGPVPGHEGSYRGNVPFGSTIGIPSSVDLVTEGLSEGGMILAKALQEHGAIMRDTTGSFTGDPNMLAFYGEPDDDADPLVQQMRADMGVILPLVRVMKNQGPTSVNGGGTPIVPPAPPLDPAVCP